MCGRTACTLAPDELCKACCSANFDVSWRDHPGSKHNYSPSYNLAPTMHTPVIFSGDHLKTLSNEEAETKYVMQPMMWNLVPHFYKGDNAKQHGYKTNNCRVESVQDKPMFSHLLKKGQRCVVLCDGFYEWQTTSKEKTKTPYLIYAPQQEHVRIWDRSSWENKIESPSNPKTEASSISEEEENKICKVDGDKPQSTADNKECGDASSLGEDKPGETSDDWRGPVLLKMAGLFSKWTSTEKEEVWSYTVLTTESGPGFNWLHHRVPVILSSEKQVKSWLDASTPVSTLLKSVGADPPLKWHEVSSEVNNSRNNMATCLRPADSKQKPPRSASSRLMSSWLIQGKRAANTNGDQLAKKPKIHE